MVSDQNLVMVARPNLTNTSATNFKKCSNDTNRLLPTKFKSLLKTHLTCITHSDIFREFSTILDLTTRYLDQNLRIVLTMPKSNLKNASRPLSTILTTTR